MEDHLYLFTEVAIAIIGFSGIAVALTQDKSSWDQFQKMNVWFVFTHSVTASIASQTYLVLAHSMSSDLAMAIGFYVFTILVVASLAGASYTLLALRNRTIRQSAMSTFVGRVIVFGAYSSGLLLTCTMLAVSAGLISQSPMIYTGGIALVLLLAIAHFAYFIGINVGNTGDA